jgi:hypothetical protein
VYGRREPSDSLGKHLQMLGVTYLMLFSSESKQMAAQQPTSSSSRRFPTDGTRRLVDIQGEVPERRDRSSPGCRPTRRRHGARRTYKQCWNRPWTDSSPMPELGPWDAPPPGPQRFAARQGVDRFGPEGLEAHRHRQLADTNETQIQPTQVSDIHQDAD